ncbi:unnamed protein product [Phyllotreta striolata]|uniref:Death domain-containing protein n=1 Tax=Phyllotreta striolata TaxID=444603 RepID=A0A9N9XKC1_PHYSR|nr:unnamed protein product [Phyllotreta striolata]
MSEINVSDITTDALPNPRNTNANHKGCETVIKNFEEGDTNIPQCHEFSKKTKTKCNPNNLSHPSASATIINISRSRIVHIGDNVTYNMNGVKQNKKADVVETSIIKVLKDSKTPLMKEDLYFAATHMDTEWKGVARALNLGEGEISQFIADNQIYGTKEVIYQILLDWYQNDPKEATVGKLCTVLWENDQKHVVQRWSQKKE